MYSSFQTQNVAQGLAQNNKQKQTVQTVNFKYFEIPLDVCL